MNGIDSPTAGRWRSSTIPLCALLASAMFACSSERLFGVEAVGHPASVVVLVKGATGGQAYEHRTTLDSATGQFEILGCNGRLDACDTTQHVTGTAAADRVERLFADAQMRAFRELRGSYTNGGFTPPDGWAATLTVVVGERRKEVRWEAGASRPEVLGEFMCLMLYVTDSFPLCD